MENSEQTRTTVQSPHPNGIGERRHKARRNECYRITFRKKISTTLTAVPTDLDEWLRYYKAERRPQGRWCYGRPPLQTCVDTIPLAKEQWLAA